MSLGIQGSTARPPQAPPPPTAPPTPTHPNTLSALRCRELHQSLFQLQQGIFAKDSKGAAEAGCHQSWLQKGRGGAYQVTRGCGTPRGKRPGGESLPPTEGSRFQQRGKQEGTSAPNGSLPTLQTLGWPRQVG